MESSEGVVMPAASSISSVIGVNPLSELPELLLPEELLPLLEDPVLGLEVLPPLD